MTPESPGRLLLYARVPDPHIERVVDELGVVTLSCASLADLQDCATPDDIALVVDPSEEAILLLAESAGAGLAVVVALDPARLQQAPVAEGLEIVAPGVGADELRARLARASEAVRAGRARRAQLEERVERARFRSLRDQLTGLPNARLFRERLQRALLRARRDEQQTTVAVLRVGGPAAGAGRAELLKSIADRIRDAVRATDTVAVGPRLATVSRGAAPEFFVLLPASRGHADPARAAQRLLAAARGDGGSEGEPALVPELAVGYAVAPFDGEDPDQLVASARAALHRARAGECRRAEPGGQAAAPASLEEFELWYQPVFDVEADEVVAVEALLRWPHPSLGLLGAADLLHAARDAGMAGRLYEAILDRVCAQWRAWADGEVGAVEIGLNIDGPEWRSPRFVDRLAAALELHGVDPDFLRLEVDERDLVGGSPLTALRQLGVRICVHDFGAGRTALESLHSLGGERVKLAREVVERIPDDASAMRTATAVAAMCRTAGVELVALGVENERQRRALAALGYELMQGIGLRSPSASEQCAGLLRGKLRRRRHATVLPFRRLVGA